MKNLLEYSSLNESVSTTTDLEVVKKMALEQKYSFKENTLDGIFFNLKMGKSKADKDYSMVLYSNGRYAAGLITDGKSKELMKGNWYATKWGVSFEYKEKGGGTTTSAASGLNAIDVPIAYGYLGLNEYRSNILSADKKYVPISSPYNPKASKASPKTMENLLSGAFILTVGSRGPIVKLVQSMLDFVLDSEVLKLLTGNYDSKAIAEVGNIDVDADGIFGKGTKKAVEAFQTIKGDMKADGIVGQNTIKNLVEAKKEAEKIQKAEIEREAKKIEKLPPKELAEIEMKPAEIKKLEILKPEDLKVEEDKTLKELRKEKRDSRKKRRLIRKLERIRERKNKIQDKIERLEESQLEFISHYDSFINS